MNGSGNFPEPAGVVRNLPDYLAMYRDLISAKSYGPAEFDRLALTFISRIQAHKNKYGTMTQVCA
jgi:hypothetical protein